MEYARLKQLKRFYGILDRLKTLQRWPNTLAGCSGRDRWPTRGVYFFQEPGEERHESGSGPRIVRVGTHALTASSKTSLWNRLSQHRGVTNTGGGNHRGSIFRLLVGTALVARNNRAYPTWGQGSTAPRSIRDAELPLEILVSHQIRSMPFLCLPIEDDAGPDSLRGYIEQNSIALLSNFNRTPVDSPSKEWLGRHCNRDRVRISGLWNQRHVEQEPAPEFLDRLEQLISNAEMQN